MSDNPLDGLLTPENIAAVEPLLNAAIDQRIAPLSQKIDNLAQGIQLLAQAQLEKAAQEPQQPPPAAPQQTAPVPMPVETPTGFAYPQQQPPPMQPTQAQPVGDKLAAFAPMLMQYLSGQNNQGTTNLANIAETLSAAAQIGNIMNKPMLDGITMATTMMSLAGRSGIEPSIAAETLGKMANDAQTQNTNGTGDTTPG
jgi:hypothetical protein